MNNLKEVLAIQSYSGDQYRMFLYIIRQLKQMNCEYYTYNGCIYAVKGQADLFPCVVAHMDTVHEIVEDLTVLEINGNYTGFNSVLMEQTGIGGDDKVGIFIALECLRTFDNIKAVFFRDEETGCEGSYSPDTFFFNDCSFVLQCDRRGNSDFVTSASGVKLSSKDFQNDISLMLRVYGYSQAAGFMTDVMALKEKGILCSMANISCGYYNPHQANEYVNISDVNNCLNLVKAIISQLSGNDYPCPYKPKVYKSTKVTKANSYQDSYFGSCEACKEMANLSYTYTYNEYLCDKCIAWDKEEYNLYNLR